MNSTLSNVQPEIKKKGKQNNKPPNYQTWSTKQSNLQLPIFVINHEPTDSLSQNVNLLKDS